MSREILFRGKRVDYEDWVEGRLLADGCIIPCGQNFVIEEGRYIEFEEEFIGYEVIPETVGQCTGLTDKKGKKIFEGDIVLDIKGDKHIVTWASRDATFRGVCIGQTYKTCNNRKCDVFLGVVKTVIGNIHDNPELLEE